MKFGRFERSCPVLVKYITTLKVTLVKYGSTVVELFQLNRCALRQLKEVTIMFTNKKITKGVVYLKNYAPYIKYRKGSK